MGDYVVAGKEWFEYSVAFEHDFSLVGQKAIGLASLPAGWTPSYAIITTEVFKRWRLESIGCPAGDRRLSWLAPFLSSWIEKLADSFPQIIIRSSAVNESLLDRGAYTSRVCRSKLEAVLDELDRLYQGFIDSFSSGTIPEIAYIVQGYMGRLHYGHLSNERRVQRNRDNWLYEIEGGEEDPAPRSGVLKSKGNSQAGTLDNRLLPALRQAANYFYTGVQEQRVHLEWVQDYQSRVWIVQIDKEAIASQSAPGSEWKVKAVKDKLAGTSLNVFKPDREARGDWDKIRCLRDFRDANIPSAQVYVLEDANVLEQLAAGSLPEPLHEDIRQLIAYPIVVRTDVSKSKKKEGFLYPRTETAFNAEEVVTFLHKTTKEFMDKGLDCSEFCFIAHRFISSRSCAFAFSKPGAPQVLVDGSWGLPDGLLYYPHDTFRMSEGRNGLAIRRHIRCKVEYLDVDHKGRWVQKRSGDNYDWAESLKEQQLESIFEYTRLLAKHLNKPIQLMFFVGVNADSGYPDVLPWFYTDHTIGSFTLDSSQRYGKKRTLITSDSDVQELKRNLEESTEKTNLLVQIKLTPEFLRKEELLEEIASVALKHKLSVELEGSILSHAYYILHKKGVRVLCPDVMENNFEIETQKFGKLVRDKIPELIESHGESASVVQIPTTEQILFLKSKAVEEALELFEESDPKKAFEELADLYEVTRALLQAYKRDIGELEQEAANKRLIRGGFEQGIVLLETSHLPLLDVQAYGLFQVERPAISLKNYADYEREIRSSHRPQLDGSRLKIPLVPSPLDRPDTITTMLPLDGRRELVVKYSAKTIELLIRDKDEDHDDPNQMTLF